MVTHLDIVPTVLDWFGVSYPKYHIFKKDGDVKLTGRSLLDVLSGNDMKGRVREPGDIVLSLLLCENP